MSETAFWLVFLALVILFVGGPDLHDVIVDAIQSYNYCK